MQALNSEDCFGIDITYYILRAVYNPSNVRALLSRSTRINTVKPRAFVVRMRCGRSPLCLTNLLWVILLCASAVSVQAGFFEGRDAHERGDYRAAVNEFHPIAERGNAWAQVYLGEMYEDGKGVPQDYQQAKMWYQKAAEQGDPSAQRRLAWLHQNHNIVLLGNEISRWPDAEGGQQPQAQNGDSAGSVRGVLREKFWISLRVS